jgi:hypothetical protein
MPKKVVMDDEEERKRKYWIESKTLVKSLYIPRSFFVGKMVRYLQVEMTQWRIR